MGTYLEFASRGRNDWWRYILSPILACLLTGLVLTVVMTALMLMHGLPPELLTQIQKPKYVAPFFLGIAVSFGSLTAGLIIVVKVIHRKRAGDVVGQWRWDFFAWGLGAWLAAQAFLALIDLVIASHGFSISATRATASLAGMALVGVVVQTFAEEFVFRGYLTQGLLLALKKPAPAAIVSGLLFGSVHIPNGVPQALNATVFGIVCALIAIRTGGIAFTYGLHIANNYFGAVVVVSGNDVFRGSPGVITQNAPELVWWDLCLGVIALAALLWAVLRSHHFSTVPAC
jgi:membrane protease YdiL (CAAX protease family)